MTISADDSGPVRIVTAVLRDGDRVLLCHRSAGRRWYPDVWDLPGGHVDQGEDPKESLVRELREELGIAVKPPCLAPFTFASHTYESFRLLMPLFVCRRWDGTPAPLHHAALKWVRPRDLIASRDDFPMPDADLPLLPMLRDLL